MSGLFVDCYFRGMMKMTLAESDASWFRGIDRVSHEYSRRLVAGGGFDQVHVFGSRLPKIAQGSFATAGLDEHVAGPARPNFRERGLTAANRLDRRLAQGRPAVAKMGRLACAAARRLAVSGMDGDLFLPAAVNPGDVWLAMCSPLTRKIRALPLKRVVMCYDFNLVYHFREMGLAAPVIDVRGNPALDVRADEWVVCISAYTRHCFLRYHPDFPPERVSVVPLGADIGQIATPRDAGEVLRIHGLEARKYFLTLAAGGTHKNSAFLIEEFLRWAATPGADPATKLVLVGIGQDRLVPRLSRAALGAIEAGRIRFTGFLPDDQLPALYGNSLAFVFASLAEGFGLPPLEAMLHGAPVICSNTTSLPEVVGAAGLLFDPLAPGALAACLAQIHDDPALGHELSGRGVQRAGEFSWDRSTERLREVLSAL